MIVADEQSRVVLTPHPLQRVGAFALARLGGAGHPDRLEPDGFREATARMTDDAVRAALVVFEGGTKAPDGFWLKCSHSFFPNSKMNHPSNGKKSPGVIRAAVEEWRRPPAATTWPAASCVLCGRAAVGYFGKVDVPLAESDIYRNTTPRGHEGTALCWPCVCSFYALPYGCRLTGGSSVALHSWDEEFLRSTVGRRLSVNRRILETGRDTVGQAAAREVVALQALRRYEEEMHAGVEMLVFSNGGRGGSLEIFAMEQPLAEWLRRRARGEAFGALVRAHYRHQQRQLGVVGLARNAFREPDQIVGACVRYLAGPASEHGVIRPSTSALAKLVDSYVREVLSMDEKDLAEIRATAGRVATVLSQAETGGKLREFYSTVRGGRLRVWLQRKGVDWALSPPLGQTEPLVTTRGFELLFDPSYDSHAWFHRELLVVGVLEELHKRGWQPVDGEKVLKDLAEDPDEVEPEEREAMEREDSQ